MEQINSHQDAIKAIQDIIGAKPDGVWGVKSQAALDGLVHSPIITSFEDSSEGKEVMASSFADAADIHAFVKCKASGKSDEDCFAVGDNGIGFTGLNCADDQVPICALPPEEWKSKYGMPKNAAGKPVDVTYDHKTVRGILGDTMPAIKNITNGARIDLNPGFLAKFNLKAPAMVKVTWKWA